ncbi:SPFH domain-containing protein [Candidatus Obscuribacterales bacterium]|nr:SPFH domain-containing protein [Candidatus Obscuribacterales bacterium]
MLIGFKKVPPTTFVMHYENGVLKRSGAGLSFFYFPAISSIVELPLSSSDVPFAFQESTIDFQEVTLQGQLTYRVSDPERLSRMLNYTVNSNGEFVSEDPDLVSVRLINVTQTAARSVIRAMTLPEVLIANERIVEAVLASVQSASLVTMLGLEVLGLTVAYIRPTPEMSRALEADAREAIQRKSDQAIYLRRNAAVEEERRIMESELNTEIAVETKKRQIAETKIAAEIAVEEQRTKLIDKRVENDKKNADSSAYSIEKNLAPFRNADWKTLMAIGASQGSDPRFALSLAFQELAENAGKIGTLSLTPDLLSALMDNGHGERNGTR